MDEIDVSVRRKASSVSGLVLMTRSCAQFYTTGRARLNYSAELLGKIGVRDFLNNKLHGVRRLYPNAWKAVLAYCSGAAGVGHFARFAMQRRFVTGSGQNRQSHSPPRDEQEVSGGDDDDGDDDNNDDDVVMVAEYVAPDSSGRVSPVADRTRTTDENVEEQSLDGEGDDDAEDSDEGDDDSSGPLETDDYTDEELLEPMVIDRSTGKTLMDRWDYLNAVWQLAVDNLLHASKGVVSRQQVAVEFERVCNTDHVSGLIGSSRLSRKGVRPSNCMGLAASVGFLNKPSVFGGHAVDYKTYIFGSNLITFDNAADDPRPGAASGMTETSQRFLSFRPDEMSRFVADLRDLVGHPDGGVTFTSFAQHGIHVQFTFNVDRRAYYTGSVFYLRGDDFCTTELVYRRDALTGSCGCRQMFVFWRVCVLVTPINVATVGEEDVKGLRLRVIGPLLEAFRRTRDRSHHTIGAFLGFAMPAYTDPVSAFAIGHGGHDGRTCALHGWLRRHAERGPRPREEHYVNGFYVGPHPGMDRWKMVSPTRGVLSMLQWHSNLVVVYRPLMMSLNDVMCKSRAFTDYLSPADVVKKYVLVTMDLLVKRERESYGVAFACGDEFLLYAGGNDDGNRTRGGGDGGGGDGGGGGLSTSEEAAELHGALFARPSCVLVDDEVLLMLGFSPIAYPNPVGLHGRTFEHQDPTTGSTCTVFCTSLLRVFDGRTRAMLGETEATTPPPGVRLLFAPAEYDSVFEEHRPRTPAKFYQSYRETSIDLSAAWPGVRMIRIELVAPHCAGVEFVLFVRNTPDPKPVDYATVYRLTAMCAQDASRGGGSHVPLPVLLTLQQAAVVAEMSGEPAQSSSSSS